jgi:hypothetical protein
MELFKLRLGSCDFINVCSDEEMGEMPPMYKAMKKLPAIAYN